MYICISDADVLVKLSRTGNLEILRDAFSKVLIGPKVEYEAKKKIGTHGRGVSLYQAQQEKWIEVINFGQLLPEQHSSIKSFIQSYDMFLDPGELEAAALANELGIPFILSDDRNAKRNIEEYTDVKGLAHYEILSLLIRQEKLSIEEATRIFNDINSTRTHPIGIPFHGLFNRANSRLNELGFE